MAFLGKHIPGQEEAGSLHPDIGTASRWGGGSSFVGLPHMVVLRVQVGIGESRFQPAESCTLPVSVLQKNFW